MKKYLGLGCVVVFISLMIGIISSNWFLVLKIAGLAILIPLILAGVFTGAFVSGDRVRANYHSEAKDTKENKNNWVKNLIFFAIPNFIFAIILLTVDYLIG